MDLQTRRLSLRGLSCSNQKVVTASGCGITIASQWCEHPQQEVESVTCPSDNPMSCWERSRSKFQKSKELHESL